MIRKTAIVVSILLIAFVTACSSHKSATDTSAVSGSTAAASASAASATTCPTTNTRHFAKTRFVLDAGLAAGAFKRYIYTPYQDGKFKKGANGRAGAITKAVLAGAFVIDRLHAAKEMAQSNPLLCKVMVEPIDKFTAEIKGLVTKGKAGNIQDSDVASASNVLDNLRSAATGAGAGFKDENATVG